MKEKQLIVELRQDRMVLIDHQDDVIRDGCWYMKTQDYSNTL